MKIKLIDFFKGHKRTVKTRKNIIASLVIKGFSIVIGFLMVRVVLNYLDQTKYGVWLTVTSITAWISFFQIGLGGGLKNKLAISIAKKEDDLGRTYVSTTYAMLIIIISVVAILFFAINSKLNWSEILNTDETYRKELSVLIIIVFSFFFLRFVFDLISIVLKADQRPAIGDSFGPLGNLISLVLIYLLTLRAQSDESGSLIAIGWVLSSVPIVVLLFASVFFYRNRYKKIAPSLSYVNFRFGKDLLNLGAKFFFIQISMIIMFQSSNIIISHFYGPAEVTPYNIAFRLFSIIGMLSTIVISPFQVAFTEAWVLRDIVWIKKTNRNLLKIWVAFAFLSIILYFISDLFFDFWIGRDKMSTINISNKLKFLLIVYFLLISFGGVFNMFINGVAKVTVQMYSHIIGAIMFVPLTLFFIKYLEWGPESVVIAAILSNFYHPIVAPIQYYKIIGNKAVGIWNK